MPISKAREAARLRAFYQKRGPKPKLATTLKSTKRNTRRSPYDAIDKAVIRIAQRSLELDLCKTPNEAVRKAVDTVRVFGGVRLPRGKKRVTKDWQRLISGKQSVDYTENKAKTDYQNWDESVPVIWREDRAGGFYPSVTVDFGGRATPTNIHVRRIIRRMKRENII